MRASTTYQANGSKATKIAIVTALHLGVALALINMKVMTPTALPPTTFKPLPPEARKVEPEKLKPVAAPEPLTPPVFRPDIPDIPNAPPDVITTKVLPPGPPPESGKGKVTPDPIPPQVEVQVTPKVATYMPPLTAAKDCVLPDYPARAAREGLTGTVTLSLLIGVNGKVADAKVQRSSGHKELDRAAVDALSMCKFKPATTNGVAEPAWGQIAYVWNLD
jgi:protein TonB